MTVAPYLSFNGQCREAMEFYADVFGGTGLELLRYGDQPVEGMEAVADRIMHSVLTIDGAWLMAADTPMGKDRVAGNVSVMHDPTDVDTGRAKFERLAEGGQVTMPFGPTFFSPGFGMLTDRFGINWMFSTQEPAG